MTQLIGFGGYALAGKDACADILVDEGWQKTYFSAALEEALLILNPWVDAVWSNWVDKSWHQVSGSLTYVRHIRYKELHGLVGYTLSKNNNDVRDLLQKLGTEIGRKMFSEDVWVNAVFSKIDPLLALGNNVCVTGVRYENELEALHERDGLSVWVQRPGFGPVNQHSSDRSLTSDHFAWVIYNDRSLADLRTKVLGLISRKAA